MLDIKMIRENPQLVHDGLLKRNVDVDFTELLSFDSGHPQKKQNASFGLNLLIFITISLLPLSGQ